MARRRPAGTRTPHELRRKQRRAWRYLLVAGIVLVVGGTALAIVAGRHMWRESEKAERLRERGVPVTAFVSDYQAGRSAGGYRPETIRVTYTYDERQYRKRIRCSGLVGCRRAGSQEMSLLVDAERPEEFLAANGSTDGSVTRLNGWWSLGWGLVAVLAGAALLVPLVFGDRIVARYGGGRRGAPAAG